MEYLIVIAVAVAIAVFDDRVRGKKKVPPPTVPQEAYGAERDIWDSAAARDSLRRAGYGRRGGAACAGTAQQMGRGTQGGTACKATARARGACRTSLSRGDSGRCCGCATNCCANAVCPAAAGDSGYNGAGGRPCRGARQAARTAQISTEIEKTGSTTQCGASRLCLFYAVQ